MFASRGEDGLTEEGVNLSAANRVPVYRAEAPYPYLLEFYQHPDGRWISHAVEDGGGELADTYQFINPIKVARCVYGRRNGSPRNWNNTGPCCDGAAPTPSADTDAPPGRRQTRLTAHLETDLSYALLDGEPYFMTYQQCYYLKAMIDAGGIGSRSTG